MNKTQIILTTEQMKKIARYELTFRDIIEFHDIEQLDIICPEAYPYTLEDLNEAVRNLKKADPTVHDFGEYWFYAIDNILEKEFELDLARGLLHECDDTPDGLKSFQNLMVSDSAYFDEIWWELYMAWLDGEDESPVSELLAFDDILSELEQYQSNKGKPILDWTFADWEMENYIRPFEKDSHKKNASIEELILCRKFLDILCSKDNKLALHIKGYACYGGDELYDCNWPVSRDCILKLYEITDKAQYANTLGYIFYYGRCTGGIPEYEKAFHYFGIAAANGLYEGMYKLADMFRHGYGCNKSPSTARNLYGMVYEDSKKTFLKGEDANFADAALRMGNVYTEGIDEDISLDSAFHYYLEADYAAKIRARKNDFFGNTTVVMNIQKALDATKNKLPEQYFKDYMDFEIPYVISRLCEENNRCKLSKRMLDNEDVELTATRLATRSCPEPDNLLIVLGPLNYCKRSRTFKMTAIKPESVYFLDNADTIKYDFCSWNPTEERYEFYYDDQLMGYIQCDNYRIYAPLSTVEAGNKYTLASICFQPGGRSYDYLCDILDVRVGDTVVVNGYDGETEVIVTNVFTKYESELGLPVERFKKVIRKI